MWRPISELADRYAVNLLLRSPITINEDTNPSGVTIGHWQDDAGWTVAVFNNYNADSYESYILEDEEGLEFLFADGLPFDARSEIRKFNEAFDRRVRQVLTGLTVTERELLGKLLMEEVMEYCFKGLGLELHAKDMVGWDASNFDLRLREGKQVDPIECADGLGDVNVVIHFAAHWQGINLDKVTKAINESNMSKLGEDGKPIINGHTVGYRISGINGHPMDHTAEPGYDPTRPIGKILKGLNYKPPTDAIKAILDEGNF